MKAVVDTNITIAANGRDTHASYECQLACIQFLQDMYSTKTSHQVCIDDCELILEEYRSYLYYKGEPGVGDRFYKFLHDNIYTGIKVQQVRGFNELPPNTLDHSDRKFLAVAKVADATVFNALDTDWHIHAVFIEEEGVTVEQLCPEHGCT
jgi:predicted nucleic acid-binding protein